MRVSTRWSVLCGPLPKRATTLTGMLDRLIAHFEATGEPSV